jgi:hypothetical protein
MEGWQIILAFIIGIAVVRSIIVGVYKTVWSTRERTLAGLLDRSDVFTPDVRFIDPVAQTAIAIDLARSRIGVVTGSHCKEAEFIPFTSLVEARLVYNDRCLVSSVNSGDDRSLFLGEDYPTLRNKLPETREFRGTLGIQVLATTGGSDSLSCSVNFLSSPDETSPGCESWRR